MSVNRPALYRQPPEPGYIAQLESDLASSRQQVRSLEAEVKRLQPHVPKHVLKGQRRPTLREKQGLASA